MARLRILRQNNLLIDNNIFVSGQSNQYLIIFQVVFDKTYKVKISKHT